MFFSNILAEIYISVLGQYRNAANGAKDVLKKRSAVCAGYSELFYELSKAARLDVWKINGNAKGTTTIFNLIIHLFI